MNILFSPIFSPKIDTKKETLIRRSGYPGLSVLRRDTVSFGAINKKEELAGFSYAAAGMFKAPLNEFSSVEDFDNWISAKLEKTLNLEQYEISQKPKYKEGLIKRVNDERKRILKEWKQYITEENEVIRNDKAMCLIVFSSITKNLRPDNHALPLELNKRALADTLDDIKSMLEARKESQFNFCNKYKQTQKKIALGIGKENTGTTITDWVKIPSKANDPDSFSDNVKKLKTLSHDSWCTKSLNAEDYLGNGDFHIYLENGKPRVGVRFVGQKIVEIQGPRNNGIPVAYLDQVVEHINTEDLKTSTKTAKKINSSKSAKEKFDRIKTDLGNSIENRDYQSILRCLCKNVEKIKDQKLIISEYKPLSDSFDFFDLGIDENDIFNHIKEIREDIDLRNNTNLESLGQLQKIGGNAFFRNSKINDLGQLQKIGGNAGFYESQITSLGQLQEIGGYANFFKSQITSLRQLQKIGGDANFFKSQITSLRQLQEIGGNANFFNSQITSLGQLQEIGGIANFYASRITSLGQLQEIGGDASFSKSQITSLGQLQEIGGNADFRNSKINDLGKLKKIGGDVYIDDTSPDLSRIKIKGNVITATG